MNIIERKIILSNIMIMNSSILKVNYLDNAVLWILVIKN